MSVDTEYVIPSEVTRAIAVGIYRDIGAFVVNAKHDNPEDYERFKAEYLAEQATAAPIRRRRILNRSPTR